MSILINIKLIRAQAWRKEGSINTFHVGCFFQFMAYNIKSRVLEEPIEFRVTNKGEYDGNYRKWDDEEGVDELLCSEVTYHCNLVKD